MTRPRNWREYWESFALHPNPRAAIDCWDVSRGRYARKRRELAALLDPRPGEAVLNIGCGAGSLETLAAAPVRRWVALDLAWNMARRTRDSARGNGHVHVIQASALQLPLAGGAFDKALAHSVTQYLSPGEVGRLLEEMARVTKPDAVIILGDIVERREGSGYWQGLRAVYEREDARGVALRLLLRLSAPVRLLARGAKFRFLVAVRGLNPADKPAPLTCFGRQELIGLARRLGLAAEPVEEGNAAYYRGRFSLVLRKGAAPAREERGGRGG